MRFIKPMKQFSKLIFMIFVPLFSCSLSFQWNFYIEQIANVILLGHWTSRFRCFRWSWRPVGVARKWGNLIGVHLHLPKKGLQERRRSQLLESILLLVAGKGVIQLERHGCLKVIKIHSSHPYGSQDAADFSDIKIFSFLVITLGEKLVKLEEEKGIVVRFMIGHR